jgi:hypothetical protein
VHDLVIASMHVERVVAIVVVGDDNLNHLAFFDNIWVRGCAVDSGVGGVFPGCEDSIECGNFGGNVRYRAKGGTGSWVSA